jgi:hypothetical protein
VQRVDGGAHALAHFMGLQGRDAGDQEDGRNGRTSNISNRKSFRLSDE